MRTIACSLHPFLLLTHKMRSRLLCRGWCFCESSVSNLIKASDMVLDLGKFDEESMKTFVCRQEWVRREP